MKKRLALLLALLILLSAAALGEGTAPVDAAFGEVAAELGETPLSDAGVVEAVGPDDAREVLANDEVSLREVRTFDSRQSVSGETWESVDLVRAPGYAGKLAAVSGALRLRDVRIEGLPAEEVDLLDYFELLPGASIACPGSDGLALDISAVSINKGASRTLKLTLNGVSVPAKKARWTSSRTSVAKISKKGKLTGAGSGSAVVTATYNGASAVCRVEGTSFVNAKKVKLAQSAADVALYGTESLQVTLSPSDADRRSLTWTTSDPDVAMVDGAGAVTGVSEGSATIRVTTASGKYATCRVTVRQVAPTAIKPERTRLSLQPGDTHALTWATTPAGITFPEFALSSSDPAVCTVTGDGLITAVGIGTADVTIAYALDPSVAGVCKVFVGTTPALRMEGLVIGINPGHQIKTIKKRYPIAPWSTKKAKGVKTGAKGRYSKVNEYETTLQIGLKLKRILEEEGATVVITRTTNDVMLTNIDRAEMLNAANVDVALQLHCNTSPRHSQTGCSGYIRTTGEHVEVNRQIAATLTAAISEICGCPDLGVKIQNEFMSLNWTTTPSVLLEMGYLTNREEDLKLASDSYRELMARAICEGLARYFGR